MKLGIFKTLVRLSIVCSAVFLITACKTPKHPSFNIDDYPGKVKVACVGDSITYGAGVENRETNCYPVALGRSLGAKFEVKNFGVSGATLLKKGDKPYWQEPDFLGVSAFAPDLIIIKLGTNDSKPQNWKFKDEFFADYVSMIEHFMRLPSKPKIWVCLPVPVYEDRWGITEAVVNKEIIPQIKQAAQSKSAPVIDLYDALSNRPDLFPDKIHPNAAGALLMAQTIEGALMTKRK